MDELHAAFKRKTIGVMRWRGDRARLTAFIGSRLQRFDADGELEVWDIGSSQWLKVPPGHWIFKLRNGDLFVVSDEAVRLFARLH